MLSTLKATVTHAFARLDTITNDNTTLNQQTWFEIQPCSKVNLFGKEVVITQPSSSFLVYLLGLLTTAVGLYYLVIEAGHMSRLL